MPKLGLEVGSVVCLSPLYVKEAGTLKDWPEKGSVMTVVYGAVIILHTALTVNATQTTRMHRQKHSTDCICVTALALITLRMTVTLTMILNLTMTLTVTLTMTLTLIMTQTLTMTLALTIAPPLAAAHTHEQYFEFLFRIVALPYYNLDQPMQGK